jgi:hypothetical protein
MIRAGSSGRGCRFGADDSLMAGEPLPSMNLHLGGATLWTRKGPGMLAGRGARPFPHPAIAIRHPIL